MSSYPLSNVLLPAVIISSAVFSTLTLPFAFIKSEPVVVELPPLFSGEIQPIFNGEHKDVAIPYIGFAIVVSVGAGMASVEVSRRWHAYRESALAQKQEQNLQQNLPQTEAQQETITQPEYRPEISALDLPLKDEIFPNPSPTSLDTIAEVQDIRVENPEQVIDTTQLFESQLTLPHQTSTLSTISEQQNPSDVAPETHLAELGASEVGKEAEFGGLNRSSSNILESPTLYQRCRIKVPHLERRLLAILVDGQYYSFLRTEKTKEKVLEIIAKLSHKVQKTIITKTEKGYFIWVLESDVSSELSSRGCDTPI